MFTMYDSVTIDEIPAEPHAVAAYINGKYQNLAAAHERFPHARILSISVQGLDTVADCYDIENGDYHPDQAADLYDVAHKAGVWRPCFYADLSNMPAVKESLRKVDGLTNADIRLWVAYYDNVANIPPGYDAHQFTCKALGRNLDESLCDSTFFQPAQLASPAVPDEPADVTHKVTLDITFNEKTHEWTAEKQPA